VHQQRLPQFQLLPVDVLVRPLTALRNVTANEEFVISDAHNYSNNEIEASLVELAESQVEIDDQR
jgi:hypothetical protein